MQLIAIANQKQHILDYEPGANLLGVLQKSGLDVHAPCGGKGTCRKCQVELLGRGPVLACQTILDQQLLDKAGLKPGQMPTVILPLPFHAQIATDGLSPDIALRPLIRKGTIQIPEPSLSDQRTDEVRFVETTRNAVPFRLLHELPAVLRETGYQPTFYFSCGPLGEKGEVIRFVRPESPEPLGMALDIGTTTLAAYLYDLGTGERLGVASAINPQNAYGADVISRIGQALSSPDKLKSLKSCVTGAIADLAKRLVSMANSQFAVNLTVQDICHYVLAGNTTMMHLLSGLSPAAIARSPFIPVSIEARTLSAGELGLPVAADAVCQMLPSVSGYVGADIIAGILACGMYQPDLDPSERRTVLLLDIGTNGEMVLSGPHGMIACSAAAGPAFEGANILFGMAGVEGAIDDIRWKNNDLIFTVIGEPNGKTDRNSGGFTGKARGICGSGLLAAVSSMLDCGLIDETGRIAGEPDLITNNLSQRLTAQNGQPAVMIARPGQSATGNPIILTQKDIREVQNAKAAIAAGIALLIERAGIRADRIDQVYLAGGFGNYLDVGHAFRIGLLPEELLGRTRAVGNTAGMGAVLCLLDRTAMAAASSLSRSVEYFELATEQHFMDYFVEAMLFPPKNLITEQKKRLRRQMVLRREALPAEDCVTAAKGIRLHLLDLLKELTENSNARQPLRIGVYSAIRQETDLSPAWPDLQKWPAELYFPAVSKQGEEAVLVFGRLPVGMKPDDFLIPGCYGIAEPPPAAWLLDPPELDCILVPGVAFDRYGSRLGWGKAFYDRLLKSLPGRPVRIGICHSFQVVENRLPCENTDQPMDWLLTPEGFLKALSGF